MVRQTDNERERERERERGRERLVERKESTARIMGQKHVWSGLHIVYLHLEVC